MGKELDELIEELMNFASLAKKEVEKIVKKGDLTPQELENVYKIACTTEKLMGMSGGDAGMGGSYGYGYDNGMSGRHYDVRMDSYGDMYGDGNGYSERRGRSPVTGRYVSRGMSGNGMSGHSIEDRMIASLEDQMDAAKNDYEKNLIMQEIQRIRMGMK